MTARVTVQYGTRRPWAPAVVSLRAWALAALGSQGRAGQLGIRVVSAAEGQRLNRRFRGRDSATNVLAFPGWELGPGHHLGDVVICAPVVAREAREQDKPLRAHWAHLVVHGVLHLLGRTHERPRAAQRMEREEAGILSGFGFPDPYLGEQR